MGDRLHRAVRHTWAVTEGELDAHRLPEELLTHEREPEPEDRRPVGVQLAEFRAALARSERAREVLEVELHDARQQVQGLKGVARELRETLEGEHHRRVVAEEVAEWGMAVSEPMPRLRREVVEIGGQRGHACWVESEGVSRLLWLRSSEPVPPAREAIRDRIESEWGEALEALSDEPE